MNATELTANQFRMTQARDKLARDAVRDQAQAIQTHEQVGKEVRDAIKRIGGTLPENIPPAERIRKSKSGSRRRCRNWGWMSARPAGCWATAARNRR
ncbi:MAG: hypothetical protein M5R42_11080 [Rhodocyclaceae bacterium]|nr:hypothetical protein [Rhodocyclaceae bacterium]